MMSKAKKSLIYCTAGILGILIALAVTCSLGVLQLQGDSMEPSIKENDYVIINKMAYLFGHPQTGDVVVFPCHIYSEDGEGSRLVKRVVATEGDQVEIKNGSLYVNGQAEKSNASTTMYMESMEKVVIEKNRVFVLNDNRAAVLDSRDLAVGQVSINQLTGKVCFK